MGQFGFVATMLTIKLLMQEYMNVWTMNADLWADK